MASPERVAQEFGAGLIDDGDRVAGGDGSKKLGCHALNHQGGRFT